MTKKARVREAKKAAAASGAGILLSPADRVKYSPDEARDDHGRWTAGGGGGDDNETQGGFRAGDRVGLRLDDYTGGGLQVGRVVSVHHNIADSQFDRGAKNMIRVDYGRQGIGYHKPEELQHHDGKEGLGRRVNMNPAYPGGDKPYDSLDRATQAARDQWRQDRNQAARDAPVHDWTKDPAYTTPWEPRK